ncbi:hypothetical protein GQ457_03G034030 [Hibiscus cannabinus]
MATIGHGLAEVYVMRSLHKQKMKKMEEQTTQEANKCDDEKENPAAPGCFSFWTSKKIHSAKVSSHNSADKPL